MNSLKTLPAGTRAASLAFEVAFRYFTPAQLQLQFDLSAEQYEMLVRSPTFQAAVDAYRREIDENGKDFKVKARKAAFSLLDDLIRLARDPLLEAKERITAIQEVARLAGYGQNEAPTQPQIAVQINNGPSERTLGVIQAEIDRRRAELPAP